MNKLLITITCLVLTTGLQAFEYENPSSIIRSFDSDQCTFWPNSLFSQDWSHCCVQHDLFFWAGGSRSDRKQVDELLRSCVRKSSGSINAKLMFIGVRLGSLSPLKLEGKQWGNAWGDTVRQKPLRPDEIRKLKESLESSLPNDQKDLDVDTFIQSLKERKSGQEQF